MDQLNKLLSDIDTLGKQGRDVEMLPIFEAAVREIRNRGDLGLLARVLNDYGGVLRNTGNYEAAEKNLQEACEIVLNISGRNTQAYVASLLNLGTNLIDSKRILKAREVLQEAYEIARSLYLQNILHASVANNLANVYLHLQEYEIAYKYQQEAIYILQYVESSKVKLAISYSNFAETCRLLGKLDEHKQYIERAETLLSTALGEEHPLYAIVVNNIASSLYRNGDLDKAKALIEKTLPTLIKSYGKESKGYRLAIENLGIINQAIQGRISTPNTEEISCKEDFLQTTYREGSGLEASRKFLGEEVYPLIKLKAPHILTLLAAALTGKGSECLGYDDHISKDHDYETKVLLFLDREDYLQYHDELENILQDCSQGIAYVIPVQDFFRKYTGLPQGPELIEEWRNIPEEFLVNATSGVVFFDNKGLFTAIQNRLKDYYPEELRRKYLAYYCIKLAQSGQYNYVRCLERQDHVAAFQALAEAIDMIMAIVYALNKRYRPFYKWQYRGLDDLPILGKKVKDIVFNISQSFAGDISNADRIETVCELIISELHKQELSSSTSTFLLDHGNAIFATITDEILRQETPWSK